MALIRPNYQALLLLAAITTGCGMARHNSTSQRTPGDSSADARDPQSAPAGTPPSPMPTPASPSSPAAPTASPAPVVGDAALNYFRDIAPLLDRNCGSCHSTFKTYSYDHARDAMGRWLTAIKTGAMPSGACAPLHPQMTNTIEGWIKLGCPVGVPTAGSPAVTAMSPCAVTDDNLQAPLALSTCQANTGSVMGDPGSPAADP